MTARRDSLIVSVDVEDWPQSSWDRGLAIGDYCAQNARRLLSLMADHNAARATFFILGKFAERHPAVVREIHAAGHEVACHGYGHEELFRIGRGAFEEDLRRATGILGDLVGVRPRGYRAPDFSVVGESLWALDVLAEQGYAYDSSIFPIDKARYGIPTWPTEAVRVRLESGAEIVEFPLTATVLRGRRVPISGGGYARMMPRWLLCRLLSAEAAARRVAPVFYCHPYEIDAGEFGRLSIDVPLRVRLHQGLGRRGFPRKLAALFRTFRCLSFDRVLEAMPDVPTVEPGPYRLDPASVQRPGIF